jgi:hypothetical protein
MTTYALILVDEYDTPYNSAYTFTDKAVWDFIHTDESVLNDASSVNVPLPAGYTNEDGTAEANGTSGSFTNDLAQYAASMVDPQGVDVMADLEFTTDAFDDEEGGDGETQWRKDVKAALDEMGVLPENTYEGLWY